MVEHQYQQNDFEKEKRVSIQFYEQKDNKIKYIYQKNIQNNEQNICFSGISDLIEDNHCYTHTAARIMIEQVATSLSPENIFPSKQSKDNYYEKIKNIQQSKQQQQELKDQSINDEESIKGFYRRYTNKKFFQWIEFFSDFETNKNIQYYESIDNSNIILLIKIDENAKDIIRILINLIKGENIIMESGDSQLIGQIFNNQYQTEIENLDIIIKKYQDIYENISTIKNNKVIMLVHNPKEDEIKNENDEQYKVRWNIAALFRGIYNQNFDQWFVFNVGECQYPDHQLLAQATHVIVPGSRFSVYENEQWIISEREWMKDTYQKYQQLKFLLICFGEQQFAESKGGKVEKMANRNNNFQQIDLNEKFFQIPFIKQMSKNMRGNFLEELQKTKKIQIKQAHGDVVTKLPENCFEVARSDDGIEMYIDYNNRLFAMQGHPEYNPPWTFYLFPLFYLKDKSLKAIDNLYQQKLLLFSKQYENINIKEQVCKDVLFMRYLCKEFLKFQV